ncbi:MAG TPA: phosphatidylglycerol lysyltransferase domain-containing protein [Ktedonobacterales bacterium]
MRTALRTALICLAGLVNIVSTAMPIWPRRYLLLTSILSVRVVLAAQMLTLFCGVLMLILAYPAAARHRRAVWTLIVCALLAVALNLAKGLDVEEALVSLSLAAGLWLGRKRLNDIPLRYSLVDMARLGLLLAGIGVAYTALAEQVEGALHNARRHIVFVRQQSDVAAHLVGMATKHLRLQHMFIDETAVLLPIFLILVFLIVSWSSLRRGDFASVDDLYARFGRGSHNSLAYMANRDDTLTFLTADGRGAIAYRLAGRVAVQIGAIMGPAGERASIYREFRAWCAEQRLIPAAVALTQEERACVAANGMRAIHLGREAVVNLAEFSLDRLAKKMRWAARSLAKRGFTAAIVPATEITPADRLALAAMDAAWIRERGGHSYGCAMTLGRFPRQDERDCLVGLMRDEHGTPVAYLTLMPGGDGYYSLDITRRIASAPNAAIEFLLTQTIIALREQGASALSLNFSILSGLSGPLGSERLARCFSFAVQTRSLEAFNNKFLPEWSPRYLAVPSWWHLPDVLYAILKLEGADRVLLAALTRQARRARVVAHRAAETLALAGPAPAANRVSSGDHASANID